MSDPNCLRHGKRPVDIVPANTDTLVPNVYSEAACVQTCNSFGTACTRAVWDGYYSYCHIKSGNGDWVADPKFDSLRLISKGNQPVRGLNKCPTRPSFIQTASGAVFEICNNTDYHSDTISVNWNLPDQASCAQNCANTPGCTLGIWDHIYKACHVKAAGPTWVSGTTQFDAIRLIAPPAPQPTPSGLTTCPSQTTVYRLDDGSTYEVCPNTNLGSASYTTLPNVLSSWDCARHCNADSTCTLSVFDHQNLNCALKSTTNANWANNNQFDVVRLLQRGSRALTATTAQGRWTAPVVVPANPVGAYIVPNTARVLAFSSWGDNDFWNSSGMTQFTDWNYQTGAVSKRSVTNTGHDMFCPGIAMLGNGQILVNGGNDAGSTTIFDPVQNAWLTAAPMNVPRGYQSTCTLSNGKIFTLGGSFSGGTGGKAAEVFDPNVNKWTILQSADVHAAYTRESEYRADNHMWLFGWKRGSVFQAGPSQNQHWYGTNGNGNVSTAGLRDPVSDAMCGMNAMYDAPAGKIWSGGGQNNYTDSPGLTQAFITTIGEPFQPSTVVRVADLPRPKSFANAVVLPDGTIFTNGGMSYALVFSDQASQYTADLYNPYTNTWTALAAAQVPRNYHSTALLLGDGTVFTGGGGLCWTSINNFDGHCDRTADHPSIEVFSPPYLFNADGTYAARPQIATVASTSNGSGVTAKAGDVLTVSMGDNSAGVKFSLVRMGSATHALNTDQRRIPLVASQNGPTWTMKMPSDYGVVIPGYYYLFAINKAGTPSLARTVQVLLG